MKMIPILCQCIIVMQVIISRVYGSCFFDLLKSSTNKTSSGDSGKREYCEYAGRQHEIDTHWLEEAPACFDCRCASYGLECCAIGAAAGVIDIPENCTLIKEGCEARVVQKNDSSKPCPEFEESQAINRRIKVKLFALKRKNSTVN